MVLGKHPLPHWPVMIDAGQDGKPNSKDRMTNQTAKVLSRGRQHSDVWLLTWAERQLQLLLLLHFTAASLLLLLLLLSSGLQLT